LSPSTTGGSGCSFKAALSSGLGVTGSLPLHPVPMSSALLPPRAARRSSTS
jgi:hypothetical protein